MTGFNDIDLMDELPFWSAPFGIKLLERFSPRKGMTVLDVGCGQGFPLIEIAMRIGKEGQVFGLDPDKEALKVLSSKAALYSIDNLLAIQGVAESIPLEVGSIDLVVSNNGLNNVQDLGKSLLECRRVLKPGGRILFTMNTNSTMSGFYELFKEVVSHYQLADLIPAIDRHIYEKRKPENEIEALLEKTGFKVVLRDKDVFHYRFASGSAFFNHSLIKNAFLPSWKDIVPEENLQDILEEMQRSIDKNVEKAGSFSLEVPYLVYEAVR